MASPALIELKPEARGEDGTITLARYSTREMVETERGMAANAREMTGRTDHAVESRHVEGTPNVRSSNPLWGGAIPRESCEGRGDPAAGEGHLARLVRPWRRTAQGGAAYHGGRGHCGRDRSGRRRQEHDARGCASGLGSAGISGSGAALAGKAAEGLEESSGIRSRTLASYEQGWQNGQGKLGPRISSSLMKPG